MALANIEKILTLDVYNHDGVQPVVKAIACDKQTRYVDAIIKYDKADYSVASDASVKLYIIRPDNVGVEITGEVQQVVNDEDFTAYMGVRAELSQAALAKQGRLKAQFKITSGEQILRTSIFYINNGEALDATIEEWAGDLDGHNLDEMAQSIEDLSSDVSEIQEDVSDLKEGLSSLLARVAVLEG